MALKHMRKFHVSAVDAWYDAQCLFGHCKLIGLGSKDGREERHKSADLRVTLHRRIIESQKTDEQRHREFSALHLADHGRVHASI